VRFDLKDFQIKAVADLIAECRSARREVLDNRQQAIVLSSPTGSGKTVIVTDLLEKLWSGFEGNFEDKQAIFLWLSDQPELNEQSRKKIEAASEVFLRSRLVTIDTDFDRIASDNPNGLTLEETVARLVETRSSLTINLPEKDPKYRTPSADEFARELTEAEDRMASRLASAGDPRRLVRRGREHGCRRAAVQRVEQLDDLGRGPGAADRHDPVVSAAARELGSLERVGLALAGLLAQRRVRLRHEPRRAATDHRDPLARGGQTRCAGRLGCLTPAVRLAGDLDLDVRHESPFTACLCADALGSWHFRAPFCVEDRRGRNHSPPSAQR